MVGRDAGAHQTPRGRQHLQHVDAHVTALTRVIGRVGELQQRCGGEVSRRAGADDRHVVWAHLMQLSEVPVAARLRARGCRGRSRAGYPADAKPGKRITWANGAKGRRNAVGTLNSRGSRPASRHRRPRHHPDDGGAGARCRRTARPHRSSSQDQAGDPNLWDDQAHAQKVTSDLSHAQSELRRVEELRNRLDDLPVLYELAAEEGGADEVAEADAERKSLARRHRGDGGPHACCRGSTTSARPS